MNFYNSQLEEFKKRYTIYVPVTIILQSCIGSIAAMCILMNSTPDFFPFLELTLCVVTAMLFNASVLAQLKLKFVFNLLITSLVINILLIIINVIRLS